MMSWCVPHIHYSVHQRIEDQAVNTAIASHVGPAGDKLWGIESSRRLVAMHEQRSKLQQYQRAVPCLQANHLELHAIQFHRRRKVTSLQQTQPSCSVLRLSSKRRGWFSIKTTGRKIQNIIYYDGCLHGIDDGKSLRQ